VKTTLSRGGDVVAAPRPEHPPSLLSSLEWVASALARPLTDREVGEIVVSGAMAAVDAHAGMVALSADGGGELRRIYDAGVSSGARERLLSIADAPSRIGRMAFAAKPTFGIVGAGALAALPLRYEERRLGLIVLGWPREREFSVEERAFLSVLADQCSLALAHTLRLPGRPWRLGDMEIDPAGNRVVIAGRPVHLTPSEFHVLVLLAEEPGNWRSRKEILRRLWHSEHVGDERACDAHLANLRKKIERDPSRPERIVTVRGRGYALQVHPTKHSAFPQRAATAGLGSR
jgi:DNA-binding winged helix-turn-helix (wHTH) protein